MGSNQLDGSLQQQPGGLAASIPYNPASVWIRRGSRDSGDVERSGVQPGGMDIKGIEVHWSILDPVEGMAIGRLSPPIGVPTLTDHPPLNYWCRCHPGHDLIPRAETRELHPVSIQGPQTQVGVSIRQTGRNQSVG
jgi:hypothetical protein